MRAAGGGRRPLHRVQDKYVAQWARAGGKRSEGVVATPRMNSRRLAGSRSDIGLFHPYAPADGTR